MRQIRPPLRYCVTGRFDLSLTPYRYLSVVATGNAPRFGSAENAGPAKRHW